MALRTGCTLVLPINGKLGSIESRSFACLPLVIWSGWADELDAKLLVTIDQQLRIELPGIHDMPLGQEIPVFERLVDLRCHGTMMSALDSSRRW